MTTPTFDRPLTEDETALLAHILMWGSKGYPIKKYGRKWFWSFRSVEAPVVYATKREAIASFETFLSVLRDCKRAAAMRNAQAALDRVADSMQRNSAELGATLDKLAQRNAQLDAQERDTLQSTASAKIERQIRAERGEQLTQEERDAEISELLDEERALRTIIVERAQLTSTHKQKAFRNGRVNRNALKAYYASTDLLAIEVTKLDAVRAQLALLTPQGMYATRTSDERIEFVRL